MLTYVAFVGFVCLFSYVFYKAGHGDGYKDGRADGFREGFKKRARAQ